MHLIDSLISDFASFVWGMPLLFLLVGGGIFFLIYSKFLPFRYFGHAIQILRGKYDDPNDPGEISHFAALTTALSATIGMGNVAGVAIAISIGGPGAVFWMWITGIVGMCTKFFTCTLAILYRGKDSNGEIQGGPMYFIMEGLGKNWKPLAILFSVAGLIGALPAYNVNQLTQAIGDILLVPNGIEKSFTSHFTIGLLLSCLSAVVIFGGIKRISNTATKLVPFMVVIYFIAVLMILIMHIEELPKYFGMIFTDAFKGAYVDTNHSSWDPAFGGVLGGLIILGVRRGAFSNEAGIGTAPMAHGAAKTKEPIREGLVAMLGPFIDTIIVCTLTALAILVTGVWQSPEQEGITGVTLTATAFQKAFPGIGNYVLLLCVSVFSISSLLSYAYYGSKCMSFLIGANKKHFYNYLYLTGIIIGAVMPLDVILNLIDGFFALMAIPTMIATLILSPKVIQIAKTYFNSLKDVKAET